MTQAYSDPKRPHLPQPWGKLTHATDVVPALWAIRRDVGEGLNSITDNAAAWGPEATARYAQDLSVEMTARIDSVAAFVDTLNADGAK